MTDNSSNSVVRAYEKLHENIRNLPADGVNSAQVSGLRADADALKQELENDGQFAFKEQRSNGSADKDEPIEHTEAYMDRSNDWLGYAAGGQLTRTENADEGNLAKLKEKEAKDAETDKRLDSAARGERDEVSNSADQRKTR
jgi:hypothetical protein